MAAPVATPPVVSVNLKAYCTTFEAFGENPTTGHSYADDICNTLHSDWKNADDDVVISFEKRGTILTGEKGDVFGRKQFLKWNRLFINDGVLLDNTVSREVVSHFIAGAFGLNAIPFDKLSNNPCLRTDPWGRQCTRELFYRQDLSPILVEGLNNLYQLAVKRGPKQALASDEARVISNARKDTVSCRATQDNSDRLDCELKELISRYEFLEERIENTKLWDVYNGLANPYKDTIGRQADNDSDVRNQIHAARRLVELVMKYQVGEDKREERINKTELITLNSEYRRLLNEIRKDKGMKTRLAADEKRIAKEYGLVKSLSDQIRILELKIKAADEILEKNSEKPAQEISVE